MFNTLDTTITRVSITLVQPVHCDTNVSYDGLLTSRTFTLKLGTAATKMTINWLHADTLVRKPWHRNFESFDSNYSRQCYRNIEYIFVRYKEGMIDHK